MRRIFALSLWLLLMVSSARADVPVLSIASGEHPPFAGAELAQGGSVNGYIQRMVQAADLHAEFHYMPWTRALEATRHGTYQATSYWYFSEAREPDFIHVGPVSQEEEVFFVLVDSNIPEWHDLEDLRGFRIGATLGYTYTPEFWDLADSGVLTLSPAPESTSNFRKLLSGRIDMFPLGKASGWHTIRQLFSAEEQARFTTLKKPLSVQSGYLLVPRALPAAQEWAAGLQRAIDASPPEQQLARR